MTFLATGFGGLGLLVLAVAGAIICERLWARIACAVFVVASCSLMVYTKWEDEGWSSLAIPTLLAIFALVASSIKRDAR